MYNYSINIVWSNEDNGFIVTIPELKNLSAFGETYEEALREAEDAIDAYIETLQAENLPVPAPSELAQFSGQTRIRLPKQLHHLLSIEAEKEGVSLNTYMVSLLALNYGLVRSIESSRDINIFNFYDTNESNFYNTGNKISEPLRLLGLPKEKSDQIVVRQ